MYCGIIWSGRSRTEMGKYLQETEKLFLFPEGGAEEGKQFQICHASNLCLLPDGEKMAVWFAGSREGADDIGIWSSRTKNGIWSAPKLTAKDSDEPHWNPVLFLKKDGTLLLFYKVGRVIAKWRTHVRVSHDFGEMFSDGHELVPGDEGGRGPVRCKVISLSDGSMLAGASTEAGIWTAYADRSEDGGKTWELTAPVRISLSEKHAEVHSDIPLSKQSFSGRGVIQPTLWESAPGRVHMMLRSSESFIFRADSEDGGRSFSAPYSTGLPNNNSGIDVARMEDGLLVLIMNPTSVNFGPRCPMVAMTSADNGKTWNEELILENRVDPETGKPGEYSYPCVIADGKYVYVTYTWNRRTIAYHVLERK